METAKGIALVTGAGSGIGRESALSLLGAGWSVVLAGRRREALEETASLSGALPPAVLIAPADVGDPRSVASLFAAAKAAYGRLDFLFNNAGTSARAVEFDELTYEEWSNVLAVNLSGAFLCSQHAFRMMKEQNPRGGRIVNNGSLSAHVPRPNSAPYTATKHAITGLTRSLSLDGRKYDIACGQIDIGNAATGRTERMASGILQPDGRTAVEPRMDVGEVAKAVLFMASLPLDANIQFLTVMATKMPFIGRG